MNSGRSEQFLDFASFLSTEAQVALAEFAELRQFSKSETVFSAGSPGDSVYILRKGRIKIFSLASSGRSTILWYCFPGELFGLSELTTSQQRMVYAEACTQVELLAISNVQFKSLLTRYPDVALQVIDLLSCRLRNLSTMMLNVTTDDVQTRLVKLLIRLLPRFGKPISSKGVLLDIPLTHQEIAEMIGTSRQTVTSLLGELKRLGLIDMQHRNIHIADQSQLQNMIDASTNTISPYPGETFSTYQ